MLTDLTYQRAVAAAVRAPSLHNTQPWLFHREGDRIELRADLSRWLPQEDPRKRELVLSCGAALRQLVLGLRADGYAVETELLPDPFDPVLLAVATVTGPRVLTLPESPLFGAVWTRHTDRTPFRAEAVPDDVVARLQSLVELDGCRLSAVTGDDLILLAVLTSRAERAFQADPGLAAEQCSWTAGVASPSEGVPARDDSHRGADVRLRRFTLSPFDAFQTGVREPPSAEHPQFLLLTTDADRPESWLTCGWALSDLLLTVETLGLAASPLTQVTELPGLRAQLRAGLRVQGHPQMVLRLGFPDRPTAASATAGRRPVADVLR